MIILICPARAGASPQYPDDFVDLKMFNKVDSAIMDSTRSAERVSLMRKKYHNPYRFNVSQMIAPLSLITVGVMGRTSDWVEGRNKDLREGFTHSIDSKFTMDDYMQYLPMAAAFAMKIHGLQGKHTALESAVILATAYSLMGITVNSVKYTVKELRPDGSSRNSFPSGHTATAFMGATFLWLEYRDVSPWIGGCGFAAATATGFFRMYNNRHWLTDVLAGAGIGILSTKAAYWLFPPMSRLLFKHRKPQAQALSAVPFYDPRSQGAGIACTLSF